MAENMKCKPWEQLPNVWKTESSFWAWVKGVLRRGWSKHPIKIEFIKMNRIRIPNPNPKGKVSHVWGGKCMRCGGLFVEKDMEVDHLGGTAQLTSEDMLSGCLKKLLVVCFADLEWLCKPCHSVRSYAQRYGGTEQEAIIAKEAIRFSKLSASEQIKLLQECVGEANIEASRTKTAAKRKEYYLCMLNVKENVDESI